MQRAGEFLKVYESKRYTLADKLGLSFQPIAIPQNAFDFADLSFYQAHVNWQEYAKHSITAIIRLGQNLWIDSEFEYNYANAKANHISLGGYWFYDDRISPADQANKIISLLKGKSLEMELFVDWENTYGGKYGGLGNVVAFMKLLEAAQLSVKDIGLYTGYYWFTDHVNLTDKAYFPYLKNKPLWLAWYAAPSIVKIPDPWTTWTHWQKGTPTLSWGQPTAEIDMNTFNGDIPAFFKKYNLAAPTQPSLLIELYVNKVLVYTNQ